MSKINSSVTFAMTLDAPLSEVRKAIADPEWHKWAPFLTNTVCEGSMAGSKRVCTMASPDPTMNGYKLQETIEDIDEEAGLLAYSIQNPPMPVENLAGVVEASANEADEVIVTWAATFEAEPDTLEQIRLVMVETYQAGLQGLEAYAQAQAATA